MMDLQKKRKNGEKKIRLEFLGWILVVKHLSLLKLCVKDSFGLNMIWKHRLAPPG